MPLLPNLPSDLEVSLGNAVQHHWAGSKALHLATTWAPGRGHGNRPYSSMVAFVPVTADFDEVGLDAVLWLSSAREKQSQQIDSYDPQVGAPVTGTFCAPQPSAPQVDGISFEGQASRVTDPDAIERATQAFVNAHVFAEKVLARHLQPSDPTEVAPYHFYAAHVGHWEHRSRSSANATPTQEVEWPVQAAAS